MHLTQNRHFPPRSLSSYHSLNFLHKLCKALYDPSLVPPSLFYCVATGLYLCLKKEILSLCDRVTSDGLWQSERDWVTSWSRPWLYIVLCSRFSILVASAVSWGSVQKILISSDGTKEFAGAKAISKNEIMVSLSWLCDIGSVHLHSTHRILLNNIRTTWSFYIFASLGPFLYSGDFSF